MNTATTTKHAIEIAIRSKGGRRYALYRALGTQSRYWHQMPVRHAEQALRDGVTHIGIFESVRAVPHTAEAA